LPLCSVAQERRGRRLDARPVGDGQLALLQLLIVVSSATGAGPFGASALRAAVIAVAGFADVVELTENSYR
jgi:hypothetical protein